MRGWATATRSFRPLFPRITRGVTELDGSGDVPPGESRIWRTDRATRRWFAIYAAVVDLDRVADRKLASHLAEGGRLRALVLELWQRTRMDWGFVTDRLAVTFRKEKWIGAHERRFVSETLYGLVRNVRRIDLAIARGTERARDHKPGSPRDVERLIVSLLLDGLLDRERAQRALPAVDIEAALKVDDEIAGERDVAKRIALAASLPDWLAARLVADWGAEAEALAHALNHRAPMTVRANLLLGDRAQLAAALASEELETTPGQWSDTALVVESRTNLFATAAFKAGALEAQDEGSQLLAELAVPATAKPLVVDYCAGAGGKTLAIAAALGNRGRIIATDVDERKLEELRRRARRAKVSNAQAMMIDDRRLDAFVGKADVVLIDAPCSGLGALRRNPEARWRLREDELAGFAKRQREIVAAAKGLCAPGGRIVYATCSLLGIEDQEVVDAVTANGELAPVALRDVIGADRAAALGDGESLVVTPHRHGTDGFFARVLRKA